MVSLQNGDSQELDSISRRSKSQQSQPSRGKGYPDSQSSEERQWFDSPVDADEITVQAPPPVSSHIFIFNIYLTII